MDVRCACDVQQIGDPVKLVEQMMEYEPLEDRKQRKYRRVFQLCSSFVLVALPHCFLSLFS